MNSLCNFATCTLLTFNLTKEGKYTKHLIYIVIYVCFLVLL
jgi:hypothetical protein